MGSPSLRSGQALRSAQGKLFVRAVAPGVDVIRAGSPSLRSGQALRSRCRARCRCTPSGVLRYAQGKLFVRAVAPGVDVLPAGSFATLRMTAALPFCEWKEREDGALTSARTASPAPA